MTDPNNRDKRKNKPSDDPKQKLQESELVAELLPDPAQPRSFTVLVGYLGKSPAAGHCRLYLTAKLNQYVDISEDDIVRSQPVGPDQMSLGAIRLWLRSNAQVSYTRVTSRQVQAEFLQGSIMRGFAPILPGVPATILAALRSSRISVNICPSDPGSTCEDVCVASRLACYTFGCPEITDDPGCTADAC